MARGAKPPSGSDDFTDFGINAALVDEIHHLYEVDPDAVHEDWAGRFDSLRSLAAGAT